MHRDHLMCCRDGITPPSKDECPDIYLSHQPATGRRITPPYDAEQVTSSPRIHGRDTRPRSGQVVQGVKLSPSWLEIDIIGRITILVRHIPP